MIKAPNLISIIMLLIILITTSHAQLVEVYIMNESNNDFIELHITGENLTVNGREEVNHTNSTYQTFGNFKKVVHCLNMK